MRPIKYCFIGQNWFQRRRFLEFWKSTNQKQELPMAAMLVNRSERNDQT